jgi:DNA/RNA-binding domain of Phe-tRNA-synthetase-like protein
LALRQNLKTFHTNKGGRTTLVSIHIKQPVSSLIPNLKLGLITYHSIAIDDSPQMLKGRLQFFQETLKVELENKKLVDYKGISEWKGIFKKLNISPSKYLPSVESLYKQIKIGDALPFINSAVDLNTFFSLQYEIPFGLYDLDKIEGPLALRLGTNDESYEGVNGKEHFLDGKLITSDFIGPFGSPIVDSIRTSVQPSTTNALHVLYLPPSMEEDDALELVAAVSNMFMQIHGGDASYSVCTK